MDTFRRVSLQDARVAFLKVETGIAKLKATSEKNRTAFAVWLLLKPRTF